MEKECKANFPKESLGRSINIRPHFSMTDQDNEGRHTHICTHTQITDMKGDKATVCFRFLEI